MDIDFKTEKELAVLSENGAYSVRLTVTSFGTSAPKLDLRRWRDGQPLKGLQLTEEEARKLCAALIQQGYQHEASQRA